MTEDYNYFPDKNNININQLVYWFQVKFPTLCDEMNECKHAFKTDEPNPYHIENSVWAHTMMVCLQAENNNSNKIVLISALLHDIGKPEARDVIPFEAKKPAHTESNEIRNEGKNDGKDSGLNRIVPPSGKKTHQRGHEGLSFYKAISVLNELQKEGVVSDYEKTEILTIISLHGTLFDSINENGEMIKPNKVFDKFRSPETFVNLVSQVINDSTGRFFMSKDGRKNNALRLGIEIFTELQYREYKQENPGYTNIKDENPSITVLIGPPASGKSTWRNENITDEVVISRDDEMVKYAEDTNIIGGLLDCKACEGSGEIEVTLGFETCDRCHGVGAYPIGNYSDIWRYLEENDLHKEVDKIVQEKFKDTIKNGKSIVIDQTNMSRKSRRKWFSNVPKDYTKKAVVFATDYDEIYRRNTKRKEETGKEIKPYIISNMMKQFIVPTFDECDIIKWVF